MKTINRFSILLLIVLFITACGSKPTEVPVVQGDNPYGPQSADADMRQDDVTIDSSSLALVESMPPQVMLEFAYYPPTPCHQLRVKVSGPDAQNRIDVTAYSVAEKDKACVLMAPKTPLAASLNLGTFPSGHYSLFLNGAIVDEFDS